MAKFRKKPVVIEAFQILPNYQSILKVEQFIEGKDDVNQKDSRFDERIRHRNA